MSKLPTESRGREITPDTTSLIRGVVVFGMLGWGTFVGVCFGLFQHYVMGQGKGLVVSLGVYVAIGWCLGLVVGWQNRRTWGGRRPKR